MLGIAPERWQAILYSLADKAQLARWLVLSLVCAFALGVGAAYAQDPPVPLTYPVVYQGEVYVGGNPALDGAALVARVGDWKSRPVAVEAGRYINLLVVPPDPAYYGKAITFHLDGAVAVERDTFDTRSSPRTAVLDLHFPETKASRSGVTWSTVAGGLAVATGLATLILLAWRSWAHRGSARSPH